MVNSKYQYVNSIQDIYFDFFHFMIGVITCV